MKSPCLFTLPAVLAMLLPATTALAYVGPGVGATFFGSLIGVLAGFFITVGLVLFWPVRRLIKKYKAKSSNESKATAPRVSEPPAD